VRRAVARASNRVTNKSHDYLEFVGISHLPISRVDARWGHGKAPHARLDRIIGAAEQSYAATMTTMAGYADDLVKVSMRTPDPGEPLWLNEWIPGFDGVAIYSLVRSLRPPRYFEVGSGVSTTWAHRARRDGDTGTVIVSVDPQPRRDVDEICDRVIRSPLELTDLSLFRELQAGDMVFIDNSHHALLNSDVVTFFFEVLPELPRGITVGIHDILLPDDYYPQWGEYYFSEQYVFAGMLMGGTAWMEPVLASWWASGRPDLQKLLEPVWRRPELAGVSVRGTSFWFRTTGRLGEDTLTSAAQG
jgi:methyltransferase family protein